MDGMITTKDVENYAGSKAAAPAATVAPPAQSYMAAVPPGLVGVPTGSYSDSDLTNMRKTIAKRLQASKQVTA
jgi:pyruvate/2-oxoglutarate dehydrogenase complex dihydrolipoamide acyltransferase (E2) component